MSLLKQILCRIKALKPQIKQNKTKKWNEHTLAQLHPSPNFQIAFASTLYEHQRLSGTQNKSIKNNICHAILAPLGWACSMRSTHYYLAAPILYLHTRQRIYIWCDGKPYLIAKRNANGRKCASVPARPLFGLFAAFPLSLRIPWALACATSCLVSKARSPLSARVNVQMCFRCVIA